MKYVSTRGGSAPVFSAEAIRRGLCPDGGLYVPEEIPALSREEIAGLIPLSYPERCAKILAKFLTDYTEEELLLDAKGAYAEEKFGASPAPVHTLGKGRYILELFHGPTAAFKDMALQIMPRLFVRALRKTGEKKTALILVATSGDTGKAALEGYRDIPGVKIQVFYPADGVSDTQKRQMQTQEGKNVSVLGIRGNFDDAQSGVKRIFADGAIAKELSDAGVFLSSANSINLGRLVPQVAYYVSAYCDLVADGKLAIGDPLDVTVPTGNFGNIFAAFLAKRMGLPLGNLICASNENNVLTDFLRTGVYDRNRPFHTTSSPSMDILISSNLERLLYVVAGAEETKDYMERLAKDGRYEVKKETLAKIASVFKGYFADEEKTARAIAENFRDLGYLADTHTAVALASAEDYLSETSGNVPMLVASTASPYKFAGDVLRALGDEGAPGLLAADRLSAVTKTGIPAPLANLAERKILHPEVIEKDAMTERVLAFAKA